MATDAPGQSNWEFQNSHALVIGIDQYQHQITPLHSAVNDATAIAEVLKTQHHYQVTCLRNQEATGDRIKAELAALAARVPAIDRLLVYFAGHGIARNGDSGPAGYLIPQDAQLTNLDSLLPMHAVYAALCQLQQCRHLLVILDCCFAGTFRWANTRKAVVLDKIHQEHYDRFIRYPAWEVLTSTASNQEALDVLTDQRGQLENTHSPFATVLLEALRENRADFTGDEVITTQELSVYLDHRIAELIGDQQNPGYFPLRGDDPQYEKGKYIFTFSGFDRQKLSLAPELDENSNPYRGLKSFEERHASLFFGRETLIEQLSQRLAQPGQPLVTVLGVSGSGKSSLVKAGLLPYLRTNQADQWLILEPFRPGNQPLQALARAVLPVANPALIGKVDQLKALEPLLQQQLQTHAQPDESLKKVAVRWAAASPEGRLLLVIDFYHQLQSLCTPELEPLLSDCYQASLETLKQTRAALQQNPAALVWFIETWSLQNPNRKLLLVVDQLQELDTQIARGNPTSADESSPDQNRLNSSSQTKTPAATVTLHQGINVLKQLLADEALSESGPPSDHLVYPGQLFLLALSQALEHCAETCRILMTLRSDFEARFQDSVLQPYWQTAPFRMRPMTSDELRSAIEGPALKRALYFDPPTLIGRLIDDVGQTSSTLPLLSFALSELYTQLHQRWQTDPEATERALQEADYQTLGGLSGALARRAREAYESNGLNEAERETMRKTLLRAVAIEAGTVTRRRVPVAELQYADLDENQRVNQVLDRLVNARLVTRGQENGLTYIEAAHDCLLRGWPELQQWIRQQQDIIILQRRLTAAVEEWQRQQTPRSYLWNTDPRLPLLKRILNSQQQNWLNQIETEFVLHSLRWRSYNRWVRQGLSIAGFSLLSALLTYFSTGVCH